MVSSTMEIHQQTFFIDWIEREKYIRTLPSAYVWVHSQVWMNENP